MFYDVYLSLCNQLGKRPSTVASELGINKSNVSNWKNNGYTPRGEVLQRIADYFGVTTDFLLTGNQKEAPMSENVRPVSDEDIKFALSGGEAPITDAQYEEVKKFVQFIRERDKNDTK